MRLHYLVLLAVAACTIDAVPVLTDSKLAPPSFTAVQNISPTNRFLRAHADTTDGEERGINFKTVTGAEAIKNVFSRKVTLKNLLKYAGKKKSPEYIFSKLKLDKVGTKLFDDPGFNVWVSYVRLVNQKNSDAAILSSLTERYGDVALSKMLESATKVEGTKTVATQLQTKLLEDWKVFGLSSNQMFNVLSLDDRVDKILANPNLNTWTKYTNSLPKKEQTTMTDTLVANFGDKAVSKMLIAAKQDPATKNLARKQQFALLAKWVQDKKEPAVVSKMLSAGGADDASELVKVYTAKFKTLYG